MGSEMCIRDRLSAVLSQKKNLKDTPVFVESLSTLEGNIAPLLELNKVCKKHGAKLIVDESLAVGVLGILGSGGVEMAGLSGKEIVSITGFQHALGFLGAAISGPKLEMKKVLTADRTYLEQPLMPVPQLHGLEEAIGLIELEVRKRSKLRTNCLQLRDGLRSMGYKFAGDPVSPIINISLGRAPLNEKLVKGLFERKIIVASSSDNSARIMVSSEHKSKHIGELLQAAEDVGKRIKAIS